MRPFWTVLCWKNAEKSEHRAFHNKNRFYCASPMHGKTDCLDPSKSREQEPSYIYMYRQRNGTNDAIGDRRRATTEQTKGGRQGHSFHATTGSVSFGCLQVSNELYGDCENENLNFSNVFPSASLAVTTRVFRRAWYCISFTRRTAYA